MRTGQYIQWVSILRRQLAEGAAQFGVGIGNESGFENVGWLATKPVAVLGNLQAQLSRHLSSRPDGQPVRHVIAFFDDGLFGGQLCLAPAVKYHRLILTKGFGNSGVRVKDVTATTLDVANYSHVGDYLESICRVDAHVEVHHVQVSG